MTLRTTSIAAVVVVSAWPAAAHRLDEYLQGTIISVEKDRIWAQMTLTPGVAVFSWLFADIDRNGDGVITEAEQQDYAARVLRDLSLSIDGHRLTPRLLSVQFPDTGEMKEGRGEIQLDFSAALPPGGRNRKLILENRHQPKISVYQVNCLVPRDPSIQIEGQFRNYTQSSYRLEYQQSGVSDPLLSSLWPGPLVWLAGIAFLLLTRLLWCRRRS